MRHSFSFGISVIAGAAMALSAPAAAHPHDGSERVLEVGDGDLLDRLIELDAKDIADLREAIADARRDIEDAIDDVEEARREIEEAPAGVRFVLRIAFTAAREATETAIAEALDEAYAEIDDAERRLRDADVSPEERRETQGAINGLRDELADLEDALRDLIDALSD